VSGLLHSPEAGLQLNAVTTLLNMPILDANKKRIMHADGPFLNQGGAARGEFGDGEDVEEARLVVGLHEGVHDAGV
jgi:hypothetical protein